MNTTRIIAAIAILLMGLTACAYRPVAGLIKPAPEEEQPGADMIVADDGSVTYVEGRREIRLRPLSDEELNRQFADYSTQGARSVNPYTFANSEFFATGETPSRFTVFRLSVKNYQYPKVRMSGDLVIESDNGRSYHALNSQQLDRYYRAYAIGYRGNEYGEYKERRSLLQRTMFSFADDIFSGQESDGYVIFEPLADDVHDIHVRVLDIVTRFDYRGEPMEDVDVAYHFKRDIGRRYPDGRIDWIHQY